MKNKDITELVRTMKSLGVASFGYSEKEGLQVDFFPEQLKSSEGLSKKELQELDKEALEKLQYGHSE